MESVSVVVGRMKKAREVFGKQVDGFRADVYHMYVRVYGVSYGAS